MLNPETAEQREKRNAARRADKAGRRLNNERSDQKNPARRKAQKLLQGEIRAGRLARQPCFRCGGSEGIHGHHEDYSKPFEVMWLCHRHHTERHCEMRRDGIRP